MANTGRGKRGRSEEDNTKDFGVGILPGTAHLVRPLSLLSNPALQFLFKTVNFNRGLQIRIILIYIKEILIQEYYIVGKYITHTTVFCPILPHICDSA